MCARKIWSYRWSEHLNDPSSFLFLFNSPVSGECFVWINMRLVAHKRCRSTKTHLNCVCCVSSVGCFQMHIWLYEDRRRLMVVDCALCGVFRQGTMVGSICCAADVCWSADRSTDCLCGLWCGADRPNNRTRAQTVAFGLWAALFVWRTFMLTYIYIYQYKHIHFLITALNSLDWPNIFTIYIQHTTWHTNTCSSVGFSSPQPNIRPKFAMMMVMMMPQSSLAPFTHTHTHS